MEAQVSIERDGTTINATYELLPNRVLKVSAPGLPSQSSSMGGLAPETMARIILAEMVAEAKLKADWQLLQLRRREVEH